MKVTSSALVATYAGALLGIVGLSASSVLDRRFSIPGLRNGGFESGKLWPWAKQGYGGQGLPATPVQIASQGYNSGHSAQVKPVSRYKQGYIFQTFSEPPATNYSVSTMYKVLDSADPSACTVEMRMSDGYHDDYSIIVNAPMVVGDWAPLTIAYPDWNPPFEGDINLYLGLNCANGTVLFDDVTIAPIGTLVPSSCAGSPIVPNGNFESGSVAPWAHPNDPNVIVVSPGANGSAHALAFSFPTRTSYVSDQIGQNITGVCFNYDYTIEFDVNWVNYGAIQPTPSDNACQLQLSVEFCNQNDLFEVMWPTAPGWVHRSFDCLATRDSVLPDLSIVCNDQAPSSPWSVQLDNIAINYAGGPAPVPTLSTLPGSTPTPTNGAGNKREEHVALPRWA